MSKLKEKIASKSENFSIPCEHTFTSKKIIQLKYSKSLMQKLNQNKEEIAKSKTEIENCMPCCSSSKKYIRKIK